MKGSNFPDSEENQFIHWNFLVPDTGILRRDELPSFECLTSRDNFYNCQDLKSPGIYVKPNLCPSEFKDWQQNCPVRFRKVQAITRYMEQRDKVLFPPEQARAYASNIIRKP